MNTNEIVFELPKEVRIWNAMNSMQRCEVMQKVPYMKSITKYHRAIIKHIKENIEQFQGLIN